MMMKFSFLAFVVAFFSITLNGQDLTITEIMYNSPGEDLEFLEFYNTSIDPIDLSGFAVVEGIKYDFPEMMLKPASTFVITNDSLKFQRFYDLSVSEWQSGSLSNSGELIAVTNSSLDTIIAFEYSDNQPWSQMTDGGGASLTRCALNNNINDPESWDRSVTWAKIEEGVDVYSSPGKYEGCLLSGSSLLSPGVFWVYVTEDHGTLEVEYYLDNAPDTTTSFLVTIEVPVGDAMEGEDYILLTDTLVFSEARSSVQNVEIEILEDGIEELGQDYLKVIVTPIDNDIDVHAVSPSIVIIGCNESTDSKLKLRGVVHSSEIKAIELQVLEEFTAGDDSYALGSANNGNGSDGHEFLISGRAEKGACIFVTNDTIRFKHFFGPINDMLLIQDEELEADYNGNDAIELYYNCKVVDTYGYADIDGAGEMWEYSDGWARRVEGGDTSEPSDFNPDDWQYGGTDALDQSTNESSNNPYPLSCMMSSVDNTAIDMDLSIYPNPSEGVVFVKSEMAIDKLVIVNNLGQIIHESDSVGNNYRYEFDQLTTSMIFVRCSIADQTIVKKIVVR